MPRKPRKIDAIGNLGRSPEAAVGEFIESQQQEEYFVSPPPNWDSTGEDSIALLLLRNSNEHEHLMHDQSEGEENERRKQAANRSRLREIYQTQTELRKELVELNSFMKENTDKRVTAEKKVADEINLHAEIRDDIETCKEDIEELTEFRAVLQDTVKDYEPYEAVLEEVVQQSDIFESVKDCMDRCDALMLAQVEIGRMEHEKIQEIEAMRKRMIDLTNWAALTVLGYKNDLAELARQFNDTRSECTKWEKIMANTKATVTNRFLHKNRSRDGIYYVYRLICKRRNIEPIYHRHEIEKLMDFIKDEVDVLREVHRECKKLKEKKANKTGYPSELDKGMSRC